MKSQGRKEARSGKNTRNTGEKSTRTRPSSTRKPSFSKKEGSYSEKSEGENSEYKPRTYTKTFGKTTTTRTSANSKKERSYSEKLEGESKDYKSRSYSKSSGSGASTRKSIYPKKEKSYEISEGEKTGRGRKTGEKTFESSSKRTYKDYKSHSPKPSTRSKSSLNEENLFEEEALQARKPRLKLDISQKSRKPAYGSTKTTRAKSEPVEDGTVRLNKFIADAGICSRRDADQLISTGAIAVNGEIVTQLGYKVKPTDSVQYGGETLSREKKVYVILNKPKDYITTTDDPHNRKTVMLLLQNACKERIYPVGRLDRNTTGLLLFTNDGEMAKKLTHPVHGARKVYHVELDKPLTKNDMLRISEGLDLEDGFIQVDNIEYVTDGMDRKQVGVELHSGKNRIVRRIFEHLDYRVVKLDRVIFAGLTKKDLPRGKYRILTEKEINFLKMIK